MRSAKVFIAPSAASNDIFAEGNAQALTSGIDPKPRAERPLTVWTAQ